MRTPLSREEFAATYERDSSGALRERRSARCAVSGELQWLTYFEEVRALGPNPSLHRTHREVYLMCGLLPLVRVVSPS